MMFSVNWLRSRQEKQEIAFWVSFAYDTRDRSLSNRLYLIYLILFFSIWWFIVLVFFAEQGASVLGLLAPTDPARAALAIFVLILTTWWIAIALKAIWRSPVVFSEEDAHLICQMPINPRQLVIRWMLLPWIKNFIPVALLSITLGFSLAETLFAPTSFSSEMFINYLQSGFQILLIVMPIHLALFSLTWVVGINCLYKQRNTISVILALFVSIITAMLLIASPFLPLIENISDILQGLIRGIADIFLAGFGRGQWGRALLHAWIFALISVIGLAIISIRFSPSRSAEETRFGARVRALMRFGFVTEAKEMKEKKRLSGRTRLAWTPSWENEMALVWKDIIQNFRMIRLSNVWEWFLILSTMASLIFMRDIRARLPEIAIWTIRVGKITSERIRNDLSRWVIFKQLPFAPPKRLFYDSLLAFLLVLISSLAGIITGGLLAKTLPISEALLLPGMIAMSAGISWFEIFKRSRSSLLIKGQAPQLSEWGKIGSVIVVCIPWLISAFVPGILGGGLSLLSSVLLGGLSIRLAVNAFRMIGND